MLSSDHRAVIAALARIARPATLPEVADLAELELLHARTCLHQLAEQQMVSGLFGERVRWQLSARGFVEHYEHESVSPPRIPA